MLSLSRAALVSLLAFSFAISTSSPELCKSLITVVKHIGVSSSLLWRDLLVGLGLLHLQWISSNLDVQLLLRDLLAPSTGVPSPFLPRLILSDCWIPCHLPYIFFLNLFLYFGRAHRQHLEEDSWDLYFWGVLVLKNAFPLASCSVDSLAGTLGSETKTCCSQHTQPPSLTISHDHRVPLLQKDYFFFLADTA